MSDDFVYWSVDKCNQDYGRDCKSRGESCPCCGKDNWRCYWGVNPEYKSAYNPGEYIQYTCAECGYVGPQLPS